MIELISTDSDKTIGFTITGKIEASDIDKVTQLIEAKLENQDKLRIYAEVNQMKGMSLAAFIKDLKFSLKHFKDFEKEAIVSDGKWLQKLAALGSKLFSSIEVKHFSFADKAQALEWINN